MFDYSKSSAAYRVRIACNLKGLEYTKTAVNLLEGAQRTSEYLRANPSGLVPMLREGDDFSIGQSIAILDYLDLLQPQPALFPTEAKARAQVMEMTLDIACDIHPLNNLRILKYLKNTLGVDEDARNAWYAHWITLGFEGLEAKVKAYGGGPYCFGEDLSAADVCLVPQMLNARRFKVDLADYPTLCAIDAYLRKHEKIAAAAPME